MSNDSTVVNGADMSANIDVETVETLVIGAGPVSGIP
jgi:hypothetical protein